ncbi:MAG: PilZ domain-containing protein [Desulfobacterales bacterium]
MSDSNTSDLRDDQPAEVIARLYELIQQLTDEERHQLLMDLEDHLTPKKRKYPRKNYFMSVQFSINGRMFNGFIKNISSGGAYVETLKDHLQHLEKGRPLVLTFQHPDTQGHVKITGEIVRVNATGIGVHFEEKLGDLNAPSD